MSFKESWKKLSLYKTRKLLFLFIILLPLISLSQTKKKSNKAEVYDSKIKKSELATIFEIKQILPEVTKKCGFWSYKFIFTDGTLTTTLSGNANILDELIRKALLRRDVGATFFIEAKTSNCKNMIGKRYKVLITE